MTALDPAAAGVEDDTAGPGGGAHGWLLFARRRLVRFVVSLWVLVTFAFLIVHLIPGDPVRASLGLKASRAAVDAKRAELGLDEPLLTQYRHFIGHLFTGELGDSIQRNVPVTTVIDNGLPNTLQLAGLAFLVTVLIAFPVGVLAAIRTQRGRHRGSELGFTTGSVVLAAIPDFVLAVLLVSVLAVSAGLLPVAGRTDASSFVIPVLALAVGPAAALARIVRIETLSVLEQDFVRTAKAKRLPPATVYLRHAVPNALTSTLTVGGLLLGGLIAGTVLVEKVTGWPGLGDAMVTSIVNKDYPLVQGLVLVYGGLVIVINAVVDVLLAIADPRSKIRES